MSFIGVDLDTFDTFVALLLLIITSGFVNAVLQYFKLNLCQDARLFQAGVLFLLSIIFGSPMTLTLSVIELIIGITDYIAGINSEFAWLDPNLA
jgi:hypothetical protein